MVVREEAPCPMTFPPEKGRGCAGRLWDVKVSAGLLLKTRPVPRSMESSAVCHLVFFF